MPRFFLFKRNKQTIKDTTPPESIEYKFARIYHRLMILKANQFIDGAPYINQIEQELDDVKQDIDSKIKAYLDEQINLSTLEEQAAKLEQHAKAFKRCQSL
jgi:Synaptobrevin